MAPVAVNQAHAKHAVAAALQADGLPVEDLDAEGIRLWQLADETGLFACIGLEQVAGSESGLLRSLWVRGDRRGQGIAVALVDWLEQEARALGLNELVLLTTTAEAFFLRRGYQPRPRNSVAPALQASAEFAALCPASAVCLSKPI